MRGEFQEVRESLSHNGLTGTASEEIVIECLRKHLSKNVGLTAG
jgi:hypothetical protein